MKVYCKEQNRCKHFDLELQDNIVKSAHRWPYYDHRVPFHGHRVVDMQRPIMIKHGFTYEAAVCRANSLRLTANTTPTPVTETMVEVGSEKSMVAETSTSLQYWNHLMGPGFQVKRTRMNASDVKLFAGRQQHWDDSAKLQALGMRDGIYKSKAAWTTMTSNLRSDQLALQV